MRERLNLMHLMGEPNGSHSGPISFRKQFSPLLGPALSIGSVVAATASVQLVGASQHYVFPLLLGLLCIPLTNSVFLHFAVLGFSGSDDHFQTKTFVKMCCASVPLFWLSWCAISLTWNLGLGYSLPVPFILNIANAVAGFTSLSTL